MSNPGPVVRRLGSTALALAIALTTVGALASAAAADDSKMLRPADVPYSTGDAEGPAMEATDLPAVGGIEICDATLGARNITIAGPKTYHQVIIQAGAGGVVSQLAYAFRSAADAKQAWTQAKRAAKQCAGTFSAKQKGLGKVTTKLTNGVAGAADGVWVMHSDSFGSAKAAGRKKDVRYSVFTNAGNAILVTSYT
ncbi:MAG: hypothetical protein KGP12_12905, partial [Actinomycetales bacterium]|nr:hypothetical protein [Actinomycetales bacterium]